MEMKHRRMKTPQNQNVKLGGFKFAVATGGRSKS